MLFFFSNPILPFKKEKKKILPYHGVPFLGSKLSKIGTVVLPMIIWGFTPFRQIFTVGLGGQDKLCKRVCPIWQLIMLCTKQFLGFSNNSWMVIRIDTFLSMKRVGPLNKQNIWKPSLFMILPPWRWLWMPSSITFWQTQPDVSCQRSKAL